MDQQDILSYLTYENWVYFRDNYLDTPIVGIALLLSVFFIALYLTFRDSSRKIVKKDHFGEAISSFSSKERLQQSFESRKKVVSELDLKQMTSQPERMTAISITSKSKAMNVVKQKVREKYLKSNKRSLLYVTEDERKEDQARKQREKYEMDAIKEKRRQGEKQKAREQKLKEKERIQKEKALNANQNKRKVQFTENAPNELQSEKSVRSGERKTTIQLVVDQNEKKLQVDKPPAPKTFSLFNDPSTNQMGSMFNPPDSAPAINPPQASTTGIIGSINQLVSNPITSIKMDAPQLFPSKIDIPNANPQPSLFQNLPKPQNPSLPKQTQKINLPPQLPPQNRPIGPATNGIISAPSQPVRPPVSAAPLRQQITLTSEEYLEEIMKFAQSQASTVEIPTLMANLGGAKSSLNDLLTFAQSFIDTINKADDSQLTTFSVKIYEGIVRQISTSNLKDGIYRIPPKSKTDQVQKNSINCYILYINLYRLMGFEKVWTIVFGKLLRLLEFIYKRKADLKKYTQLELLANKHLEKRGELEGKYLSRIDYLTYLLFGLTAFDPVMVFRQTQEKEPNVRESRERVESWGREWNYKQFWMMSELFLKNKHDSYFKPIVYMNILSALYPRIYSNKQNPERFKAENEVYKLILEEGKKYFAKFKTIPELKALKESEEGNGFEYDGDNFVQDIKVLESRLTVQKVKEFNVRLGDNNANAREFQSKSNVFYYFSKEK